MPISVLPELEPWQYAPVATESELVGALDKAKDAVTYALVSDMLVAIAVVDEAIERMMK